MMIIKHIKKLLGLVLAIAITVTMIPVSGIEAKAQTTTSDRVAKLVEEMSIKEKVTQMIMIDFRYWDENVSDSKAQVDFTVMNNQVRNIVEDYGFGAVIFFAQNIKETEQSYNLTMEMQKAATKDNGIAMLVATDQEGGSVYRLGTGTALPGNMALGATYVSNGTSYAYEAGKIIGSELSSLGINTTLSPVVDVNNNPSNPVIGLRSYSDNAVIVGELASATIEGLNEYDVIGCAKHFPGHGDTATDSHYGLPIVDKSYAELKDMELKPYEIAIEQGIDMIMTAHILYPALEKDKIVSDKTGKAESLPATMSDDIITGLLKKDMGFDGIVITDGMNMAGISNNWDSVQAAVITISAGVDMLCMPVHVYNKNDMKKMDAIIQGLIDAVEDGEIPESRINDAVTRILTVKEKHGLLDWSADDYSLDHAKKTVGSDTNRNMERELAAAAVTVVRNDNNVLPLKVTKNSKVLMLVPYNNERAQVLMGWNRAKEAGLIPDGAQVDYYRFSSSTISTDLQKKLDWADTYIIISEVSSLERMGYKHWLSAMPNELCNYAEKKGKTAIVASCDKPYDVQLYPNADAVLAAYGCKGSSVDPTEALVGGVTSSETAYGPNIIAAIEVALGTYPAQGKLPVEIPVYDAKADAYKTAVAYERGFGLTYYAAVICAGEHKYGTPEITDSTCEETGMTKKQCGVCGYIDEEVIPKKGHAYGDDWTVEKEATCEDNGVSKRQCSICNYIEEKVIPANGHVYSEEWTIDKEATCEETGSKSRHCTGKDCQETTDVTEIPKKDHQYDAGTITTEATLTSDGVITYTCEVCKTTKTEFYAHEGLLVERVYGQNRYDTAYAIADMLKEQLKVEKFSSIIVADGTNFPDALTGSYLAAKKNAPILMVNGDATKKEDKTILQLCEYIEKNLVEGGTIYLLGGTAAIPELVENALPSGYTVKRLYGKNRYETNIKILEEAEVNGEDIIICTGKDFADSLSASSTGCPILLVNDALTTDQLSFLKTSNSNMCYVVGGEKAVSVEAYDQISRICAVKRIKGANRYETSVKLAAEKAFYPQPDHAVLAYAYNFPDGLCGGPLAYSFDAPLILVGADIEHNPSEEKQKEVAKTAVAYMEGKELRGGVVLGGEKVLPDFVVKYVFDVYNVH